jgi:hypothetical protein
MEAGNFLLHTLHQAELDKLRDEKGIIIDWSGGEPDREIVNIVARLHTMRRYTLTFLEGETPVAQLLLDVRIDEGVERWVWRGDDRVRDAIAPTLPNNDERGYSTWYFHSLRGAKGLGLQVKEEYEGEPFGEYDHYYTPDDPNGPRFRWSDHVLGRQPWARALENLMRRYILTFLDKEVAVAQLLLDLRLDQSVEKWSWLGDERVRNAIAPTLPNDDQLGYTTWHVYSRLGARNLGLQVHENYEGEPIGEFDH